MHWFPKRDNLCGNQWKSVINGMAIVSMVIISVMFVYGLVRVACLTALFGTPPLLPPPRREISRWYCGQPTLCLNVRYVPKHSKAFYFPSAHLCVWPWPSNLFCSTMGFTHCLRALSTPTPLPPFTAHLSTLTNISTTIHKVLYVVCILVPLWVFKYTCLSWYPPGVCVKTV